MPRRTPRRYRWLAGLVLVAVGLAGACGGDGDGSALPEDFDLVADGLPEPVAVTERAIDTTRLGGLDIAGNVNDGFDRCGIYSLEELGDLLGGAWQLTDVRTDGVACVWRNGEDAEVLEYVRIAIAEAQPTEIGGFDPRLGDDASDLETVLESDLAIGDETYEVPTGTYGPGLAFRKGDTAVQVHAVWGVDDVEAGADVEHQIERRVAENLASRLP